jgi:peptide/nickel transport system permease protein
MSAADHLSSTGPAGMPPAHAPKGYLHSPLKAGWRRLLQRRSARWSLHVLATLGTVALFADFIANDKPLYCRLDGTHYFPVLRQYAVDLGWKHWEPRFMQQDWQDHAYETVIFPPIPFAAKTIDPDTKANLGPFHKQQSANWRRRHWLGTDPLGHDVAAGMVAGTRVALSVGIIAMAVATAIGLLLGAVAGYFSGSSIPVNGIRLCLNLLAAFLAWFYGWEIEKYDWAWAARDGDLSSVLPAMLTRIATCFLAANILAARLKKIPLRPLQWTVRIPPDPWILRTIEIFDAIPGLLFLLALLAVVPTSSIWYVMGVIGLLRWTDIARFMRAAMLEVSPLPYIDAARVMGFSPRRILFRHALPNALSPVLITISFGIASAILLEAALSFLGFGIAADQVTWGQMLAQARQHPQAWWLAVLPGLAIFLTVSAFNLLGEALSDSFSAGK